MCAKRATASGIAAVFALFVLVSLASACPFFVPVSAKHSMPCCPRQPSPAQKCPLSKDIQTCPFYVTEAKLGIAGRIVGSTAPAMVSATFPAVLTGAAPALLEAISHIQSDGSLTYLHNRVLRI